MSNGNGKPSGSMLITLLLSIALPAVSGGISATIWAYSMRDQAIQAIEKSRADENAVVKNELSHYLTMEAFLDYRRAERERQDAQYFNLIESVRKVETAVQSRR